MYPELRANLLDDAPWVCTGTVHLVDEGNPRNVVPPHLPIDRGSLTLHACHGAEDENSTIQNPKGALDFDGEVDVTYTNALAQTTTKEGEGDIPGVSIMLMAYFSLSPEAGMAASQSQKVAALWMVMPFSRSSSMLSILAPTLSRPRTWE